jgi:hypothetical protein
MKHTFTLLTALLLEPLAARPGNTEHTAGDHHHATHFTVAVVIGGPFAFLAC